MQHNFILLKKFDNVKQTEILRMVEQLEQQTKAINGPQIIHDSNFKNIAKARGR